MPLIPDHHRKHVIEELASLENPVRVIVFTQEFECDLCRETRELAQEIAQLSSGKVTVEVYDLVKDAKKASEYIMDKVPALAIITNRD